MSAVEKQLFKQVEKGLFAFTKDGKELGLREFWHQMRVAAGLPVKDSYKSSKKQVVEMVGDKEKAKGFFGFFRRAWELMWHGINGLTGKFIELKNTIKNAISHSPEELETFVAETTAERQMVPSLGFNPGENLHINAENPFGLPDLPGLEGFQANFTPIHSPKASNDRPIQGLFGFTDEPIGGNLDHLPEIDWGLTG